MMGLMRVDDSISLFGVHWTASLKSEVAVIGGSGKYENAKGDTQLLRHC